MVSKRASVFAMDPVIALENQRSHHRDCEWWKHADDNFSILLFEFKLVFLVQMLSPSPSEFLWLLDSLNHDEWLQSNQKARSEKLSFKERECLVLLTKKLPTRLYSAWLRLLSIWFSTWIAHALVYSGIRVIQFSLRPFLTFDLNDEGIDR